LSEDKPLHVRVAEALGCKPYRATPGPDSWRCGCQQSPTALNFKPHGWGDTEYIARYDTDWSATGPLVEKYGIEVVTMWPGDAGQDGFCWSAQTGADARSPDPKASARYADGSTPLIAVCNLILKLAEAGKLDSSA
jgi:hypothetical protein